MTEAEKLYISIGEQLNETIRSQMFGKPCFKIHGKAFLAFFQNEMVFKLYGDKHREALALEGAQLFDPSGKKRPMKEWVQLPYIHAAHWTGFAKAALEYVSNN